jgi:glycosyltransferase involved in cell wall biosynthesis
MPQRIYQLLAGFHSRDAISNAALLMRSVFRAWGCDSEIVVRPGSTIGPDRLEVRATDEALPLLGPDDIAILHLSIGNPINFLFAELKCRKVIVYHNVTPDQYFRALNPQLSEELREGRRHVALLKDVADLAIAVSEFNAGELRAAGYRRVVVLPLPINIDLLRPDPDNVDQKSYARFRDGKHLNVLFVGRFVPNKKFEHLICLMYFLKRIVPNARLILAGSTLSRGDVYTGLVQVFQKELFLDDILYLGSVKQNSLTACYKAADAFLCLSEHEGFCAPLIEAMLNRIPVFSLASSAIPETLAGAGVLFPPPPDFPLIAETIAEVWRNPALREAILARQDRRVEQFRHRDLSAELREALAPVLA